MAEFPPTLDDRTFRDLVDGAPDAILVVHPSGRIVFANSQANRIFGYTKDELSGLDLSVLIPQRYRDSHTRLHHSFMRQPENRPMGRNMDLWAVRKNGTEFPTEISLSPIAAGSETWAQAVVRDVTEAHARRNEIREARKAAEKASQAKSEFLASMSHELRTPLNSILGFSQLMERDRKEPLSERQRGMVAHITRGGQHLLRLIDEVLDLSRIEAGVVSVSLEPVSVTSLLAEVVGTLSPLATSRNVTLIVSELPPDLTMVRADRTRLAQVLLNFGTNSIKYGSPRGTVRLAAQSLPGSRVRVSVQDDGPGIPDEHQAHIFEPFQRAGQEGGTIEGTGIGLTISQRLARLMGGDIGFISNPGEGSTFWIDLDAEKQPRALEPARKRAAASSAPADLFRVLYVEDNEANVAFMKALLEERDDIALETCRDAESGLALATSTPTPFNLIILDVHLPRMSGVDAARALRSHPLTSMTPLVALSAAALPDERSRALEAGFSRYLTKPLDINELDAVIDDLMARRG